jgi:hypothetical protein
VGALRQTKKYRITDSNYIRRINHLQRAILTNHFSASRHSVL